MISYYQYFVWDYKEYAPAQSMIELGRKHPGWRLFILVDLPCCAIMTDTLENANRAVLEIFKESIYDDPEWIVPTVAEWKE